MMMVIVMVIIIGKAGGLLGLFTGLGALFGMFRFQKNKNVSTN